MENLDLLALEYYRPEYEHKSGINLHYNYFYNGTFEKVLFSNDYKPLALIPHDFTRNPAFRHLCDWLYKERPSYEDAVRVTYHIIAEITLKTQSK